MYEGGICLMRYSISDTAQYGDQMITAEGSLPIGDRKEMKKVLTAISNR
jgi:ketol-acid reductoisomerase